MHTVPQNKDKFTINNSFYCCKALIFTHPLVYEFLFGPKHMGTPVYLFNSANRFPLNGSKQSFVNTILGLKRLTYKMITFRTEIQVVLKSEIRINHFDWKLGDDSKTI